MSETHSARRRRAQTAIRQIVEAKDIACTSRLRAAARHVSAVEATRQCSPALLGDAITKAGTLVCQPGEIHP